MQIIGGLIGWWQMMGGEMGCGQMKQWVAGVGCAVGVGCAQMLTLKP